MISQRIQNGFSALGITGFFLTVHAARSVSPSQTYQSLAAGLMVFSMLGYIALRIYHRVTTHKQ